MSPSTIARIIVSLVDEGLLQYEQVSGQMKILALDESNSKTQALIELYETLKKL
jgi:hypothetical protein